MIYNKFQCTVYNNINIHFRVEMLDHVLENSFDSLVFYHQINLVNSNFIRLI